MVDYLNMSLLQIYQWVCQWMNFENRLTFGEVMGKSLMSCFFERVYNQTGCVYCDTETNQPHTLYNVPLCRYLRGPRQFVAELNVSFCIQHSLYWHFITVIIWKDIPQFYDTINLKAVSFIHKYKMTTSLFKLLFNR